MIAKNMMKKIIHSFGRFISLVAIILIGVGFYAGIRQSTPAIRVAENEFVQESNMMDIHLLSTLGFSETDKDEIENLSSVDSATLGYSKYVYSGDDVIRVMSIDTDINRYKLWDGNLPLRDNECLADSRHYKVGDIIVVSEPKDSDDDDKDTDKSSDKDSDSEDDLTEHKFIVTGTVTCPIYMGTDYGSANIGNGELRSYILVREDVFDMEAYTDIYVTFTKNEEDIPYSDSYEKKLETLKSEINSIKSERQWERESEVYNKAVETAHEEVDKKRDEIESDVRDEVEEAVREEVEAKQEEVKKSLREQAGKLGMTFENFIANLSDNVTESLSPITDAQINSLVDEQMDDAMVTAMDEAYATAVEEIEIPECKWIVQTRNDVVANYKILIDQYKEVDSIADIIPIFFIVVVILMTSNTMSRMIAEERGEMGTFTSLGFSNGQIIGGYMIYVIMATLIGCVGGYFIGVLTLPDFVYNCFPLEIQDITFSFNWKMFVGCMAVSFVVMTGVTIFSCMKELKEKPAYLLRPVPPKKGRRIILERTGLWNHLSFSWKTTFRNIARYRRRVLMTVLGVGGCTFLMFIGFGIRDCIATVGDKQFSEIHHYDEMVILGEEVKSYDEIGGTSDKKKMKDQGLIVQPLMMRQESYKVTNAENHSLDVYLMVPDMDNEMFQEYFTLRGADPRDTFTAAEDADLVRQGETLDLTDEGVIITPRISIITGKGVGDYILLFDDNEESYEVKIAGIAENYVSNYIYMSKKTFIRTFRHGVMYNTVIGKNGLLYDESGNPKVDVENMDSETRIGYAELLAKKLYKSDDIVNVSTTEAVMRRANDSIQGLDSVVVMLAVIASLLAFTVLYNLTAISISERTREIATLKVLGFTPVETNHYIYRETILSSLLGIVIGLAIGPYLLGMVMDVIGVDNLVFLRQVKVPSFAISAALTLVFTLVMMAVTFIRLMRIDMIESLKSVD